MLILTEWFAGAITYGDVLEIAVDLGIAGGLVLGGLYLIYWGIKNFFWK